MVDFSQNYITFSFLEDTIEETNKMSTTVIIITIVVSIFVITVIGVIVGLYYNLKRKFRQQLDGDTATNIQQEDTSAVEAPSVLGADHPLLEPNTTQSVASESDITAMESLSFLHSKLPSYEETIKNTPTDSPPCYDEEETVM